MLLGRSQRKTQPSISCLLEEDRPAIHNPKSHVPAYPSMSSTTPTPRLTKGKEIQFVIVVTHRNANRLRSHPIPSIIPCQQVPQYSRETD